ncbi:electron transport complex subunit RsxC [uncultured Paraglaciecola sp.]|uniref:electron transport complex subunit RsxC n=1 Tax=uncultured Paraglaciecola sp. TaxID=1765024 RepID=UPI00261FE0AA|nr:electron transport complex subunit RsxC [uncultured Paraglaciecola sp.]
MHNSYDNIIEKLNNHELWDFPGGVFPAERKTLSNQIPIAKLPIPEQLYVTVKQHIGVEGHVIVELGQKVLKGQALTKSMNPFAVPVHAPTSGEVTAIHNHVSAHPSGLPELTVQITSDQQDTWTELSPLIDYQNQPKMQLLTAICEAGISGMGGAGFPTHIKSSPKKNVEFLIINGIECEPYITSDDRLMREHAWQVRQGIDVLCHLLEPKHVIIGIEANKPEAIEAMQVACRENPNYRVCDLPTKYPTGGEKQLIQVLTGREVPANGLPIDVGVIMHNVGTCFAIADAVFAGKPLVERVVTVTGEAITKPGNFWAMIGSPIAHLLNHTEFKPERQKQANIIMGGPMMGFSLTSDLVPVVKTTNCILAPNDNEISHNNEQPCIRCGACADACPASLLPQQLFWHAKAKELDKAQEYNLFDCIECGACAYVCPSEIPLVHYYRIAKSDIKLEQDEKQKSDKARVRFEKREARLIAEQQARDEKHRLAAEARKQAMATNGSNAKDKIAAALARAKAKKQSTDSPNEQSVAPSEVVTNTSSEHKQSTDTPSKAASSNQRVQAAIARAKAKKAAAETSKIDSDLASQGSNDTTSPVASKGKVQLEDKATQEKSTQPASIPKSTTKKVLAKTSKQPEATDNKQAKIAAAVAKAKAKREAQKAANSKDTSTPKPISKGQDSQPDISEEPTQAQQIEAKKRKIAAAVAKAKAKKAAEKAAMNKADKS